MKLAKTSPEEISSLNKVLNELEWLRDELSRGSGNIEDVDLEDYEVIGTHIRMDSFEHAFNDLVKYLAGIHFQRILTNCQTMLDHCADPDQDTLEFNPDITKGLELLQRWVDKKPCRRLEFPVLRVAHADLDRIGVSAHTRQCPECSPGTLPMARDPETMKLLDTDACLYCGQRFVYTDVVDGVFQTVEELTQ